MTRLKKTLARTLSSLPRLEQAFAGLTGERVILAAAAAETERSRMEHLLLNREDTHTLSVYVANKPGVLARIAQVFARRGYNIDSLVVSSSMDGKFSRMTVTGHRQSRRTRPDHCPGKQARGCDSLHGSHRGKCCRSGTRLDQNRGNH
jgi:hypothetical protein